MMRILLALLLVPIAVWAADIHNMTDTWDDGNKTWHAIKMDATDSASASDSRLLHLLLGGSSQFIVEKTGDIKSWGGIIANEGGEDTDFRVESTGETSMLHVDSGDNQVVVHGNSDPNYGALFVLGRTTGGGADNDVVATLGEDDETVQLNSGNTGRVSLVQFQTPELFSNNSASPASLDNVRIEGAPDDSGANITPAEKHALNVEEGDTIFQPFDVESDGGTLNSPDIKIRAKYDSDSGGGVTSSNRDAAIRHNITSASPESQLDIDINGATQASLFDSGNLHVSNNIQGDGTLSIDGGTTTISASELNQLDGKSGIAGQPGTSSDPGLSFGTWRQISTSRHAEVQIQVRVDPTAGTAGRIDLEIDESGDTTADYSYDCDVPAGLGADRICHLGITIPVGAQYRIVNTSDPDGGNAIEVHREFVF